MEQRKKAPGQHGGGALPGRGRETAGSSDRSAARASGSEVGAPALRNTSRRRRRPRRDRCHRRGPVAAHADGASTGPRQYERQHTAKWALAATGTGVLAVLMQRFSCVSSGSWRPGRAAANAAKGKIRKNQGLALPGPQGRDERAVHGQLYRPALAGCGSAARCRSRASSWGCAGGVVDHTVRRIKGSVRRGGLIGVPGWVDDNFPLLYRSALSGAGRRGPLKLD